MELVVTKWKKAMENDGISFAHWQREGNLQTPPIPLSHDLTMTIKILISKTIWQVVRMQQQIRKVNVSLNVSLREKKETIEQSLLILTKSFIDNNPPEKLLTENC